MRGTRLGRTGGAIGVLAVAVFAGLAGPLAWGAALPGRSKAAPVGPGQPAQLQTDAAEALGKSVLMPVDLGDGAMLDLMLVPAGSFRMGSLRAAYKDGAAFTEMPDHEVVFEKPFYMGSYEVTQRQWEAVMGSLPGMTQPGFNAADFRGPQHPVVMVSWETCQEFIGKLNQKTQLKFSLPSEAEWEYACRAGKPWRFCFGDKDAGLGAYAWYAVNSGRRTRPVGQRLPNAWGLCDMHGNVWEWCEDLYHPNYTGAPADGSAWIAGGWPQFRVVRGGSWESAPVACRSAARERNNKGPRWFTGGLRVVLREF